MDSIEAYRDELLAERVDAESADEEPKNDRDEFVAALRDGATFERASAAIGKAYRTTKDWRDADPEFEARCKQAVIDAKTSKIESARVEALDGLRKLIRDGNPAGIIFACKALLGMVETSRVESVEVVPIIDDIPDE